MSINFQSVLKQSKVHMSLCLLLIALSAIIYSRTLESLLTVFLAVFSTLISDLVLVRLRKVRSFFPSAALVSGLIIGLLSFYQLPWYEIVLTSLVAMIAKNFVRIHNRHIFNPAGFGLFTTTLVFHQTVSWWGVSFQNLSLSIISLLSFVILLLPGLVSMIRMKRYFIAVSFLIGYFVLNSLIRLWQQDFNLLTTLQVILIEPTILFFCLVMLPEPMTSPHNHKRQIIYGLLVATAAVILPIIFSSYLPDPLIGALLLGNLVFFKKR